VLYKRINDQESEIGNNVTSGGEKKNGAEDGEREIKRTDRIRV